MIRMSTYVSVCIMIAFMYARVYARVCMHACACTRVHARVCMHACACTRVHARVCMHACACTRVHACTRVYARVCMHACYVYITSLYPVKCLFTELKQLIGTSANKNCFVVAPNKCSRIVFAKNHGDCFLTIVYKQKCSGLPGTRKSNFRP